MSTAPLTIRAMTRQQLDMGIDWAAQEGWNPGLHDADSFYASDPQGFLIGLLNDEPVGMVSAVRYGSGFGFIGLYIVRPAYRGQGHGFALWNAAMQALAGRVVGLDGVVEQQDNYRKSGFTLAHKNVRYQGVVPASSQRHDKNIVPVAQMGLQELLRYDVQCFPAIRTAFLQSWVVQRDSTALALLDHGQLAGYGVVRPCRSGYKVGPLFADSVTLAQALLQALLARLPKGASVQLDVPMVNLPAIGLAQACGMSPVFETARMYTGPAPRLDLQRTFGITTFELG